jgi:cytochrome c nitrite reductase small subunit
MTAPDARAASALRSGGPAGRRVRGAYRLAIAVLFGALLGLPAGVGAYTFVYARGASYLSDDPAACSNCHVMRDHYSAWIKSSHRYAATCNDCHTPRGLFAKYLAKAEHGFAHSVAFTTGWFHEPIRIKPHDLEVTEEACRRCHGEITEAIEHPGPKAERLSCVRCHGAVGHPF